MVSADDADAPLVWFRQSPWASQDEQSQALAQGDDYDDGQPISVSDLLVIW